MTPINIYGFISAVLIAYSIWMLVTIKKHDENVGEEQKKVWWVFVVLGFAGALGLLSTIPRIFFNEPNWLLDKIFSIFI